MVTSLLVASCYYLTVRQYILSLFPQDLLVNLSENRPLVEQLLTSLPTIFGGTRVMESALGPGLDAAFNIMQHIGGKLVVLQVS